MSIHEPLLQKARAAGARLAEAEREVQRVRTEYHALVRRLHLAGGSLRELAQALELSHQRVQQMVEGAGGSWWQRVWRSRNLRGNLHCTFCKRSQDLMARLIAGPKVFICDECVAAAEHCAAGGIGHGSRCSLSAAAESSRARCSFCGKQRSTERRLLTGPEANICVECLSVCRQILTDSGS